MGVQSAAVAEVNISRESKVGGNVLEWYPHLMSKKTEKNNKNFRPRHQSLHLEINIADLRKVFMCTVTYCMQYLE